MIRMLTVLLVVVISTVCSQPVYAFNILKQNYGVAIDGGLPRYAGDFESDIFGLYKFGLDLEVLWLQWRRGLSVETALIGFSTNELQRNKFYSEGNCQGANVSEAPSIGTDNRISMNKVGAFLECIPPFLGANNTHNCVSIRAEAGWAFYELRDLEGLRLCNIAEWDFYLDLGVRFTQRLSRNVGLFARPEISFINNSVDAWEDGSFDLIWSLSFGIEINRALPRPHKFH